MPGMAGYFTSRYLTSHFILKKPCKVVALVVLVGDKHLLSIGHYSKHVTNINSFNPHNSINKEYCIIPILDFTNKELKYRWVNNLLKIT